MKEHMPTLDAPGARLHYRTAGDGPPLVLVHGSSTDMTTWDGVVGELAQDHRVVIYDGGDTGSRDTSLFVTTVFMPAI
jgi:pimeloyl-ACP methyl ester carboxylesterase